MLNQLSPGVNFSEIDNTTRAPAVSTSIGAFAGNFRWGPVDEITTVVSEPDFVSKFGAPTLSTTVDFHTALQFVTYSRNMQVARVATASATNANAGGDDSTVIKNQSSYETQTFVFEDSGSWAAKYPGQLGNSLTVSMFGFNTDATTTQTNFNAWQYSSAFAGIPSTSEWAASRGSSNDEVHIVVIDAGGEFSGVPGTILEVFPYVSLSSDAKTETGASNYFATVVSAQSSYIWFTANDTVNFPQAGSSSTGEFDFSTAAASGVVTTSLTGGADSSTITASDYAFGYNLFADSALADVSIIVGPNLPTGAEGVTIANQIIGIAESRLDLVATFSPPAGLTSASDIVSFFSGFTSSTYSIRDSGRMIVYDKYNDQFINIPSSGSVGGLLAETDRTRGSWYSPAGFRRGQIRNVTRLEFNPNKADRDALYAASINPIVTFPSQGTVLFGDKTGTSRPSAFDRINVRRLFIVIEKSAQIAARDTLFELNNEFTRNEFINIIEPLLRTIQGRNGITDFLVVVDETNNTGDVIDRNEFVADIYVQPARSINFIQLNFIGTRTGASFNTIVGNN